MDAYLHVISVIKKLGYICDTLPYLIDYQSKLFSRRSNKREVTLIYNKLKGDAAN